MRRNIGQQPETKSARGPGDKPRINRVRASKDVFETVVLDTLVGARDGCVLREQTCRRPILLGPPRPAAPPCAARPDPPWYVRVLDSTNS